jgi:hypothetical protein
LLYSSSIALLRFSGTGSGMALKKEIGIYGARKSAKMAGIGFYGIYYTRMFSHEKL